MARQKKNNHSIIPPVPREAIASVRGEEDFVELLRREREWPIPMNVQRLTDVTIPRELLREKLHDAINRARARLELKSEIEK